ncbi:hypothetical protein D6J78_12620 [Salmonella enterica subsp. enterica serovar Abaetetuba]|nr:hypothetical protein [Salmonella enterica]EBS0892507.1 hypothetical protein [Salmonella enterica subsp. enterica serovar Abaetetuba]ECH8208582.1 hypothetical protein [Salmonella enterica subsp. enterica]EAX7074391.1 hypothetical protein [Salmonella enterica]EBP2220290.1 hypothetical protein [Salmonella enterica]
MNREEVNLSIRRQKPGLLSGAELLAGYERGHPSAVAYVFSAAGFPDFGKQLQQLAKEPSPR